MFSFVEQKLDVPTSPSFVTACPCLPLPAPACPDSSGIHRGFIGDSSGIYRECFTVLKGVSQFTILPIYRGSIRGFTPMLRTKIIIISWT